MTSPQFPFAAGGGGGFGVADTTSDIPSTDISHDRYAVRLKKLQELRVPVGVS